MTFLCVLGIEASLVILRRALLAAEGSGRAARSVRVLGERNKTRVWLASQSIFAFFLKILLESALAVAKM
jgi:hypothetical protein